MSDIYDWVVGDRAVLGNVNIADNDAVLRYTIVVDGK